MTRKGYGVQSPSDYKLVREVIKGGPDEVVGRMARHIEPGRAVVDCRLSHIVENVEAGWKGTEVIVADLCSGAPREVEAEVDMIVARLGEDSLEAISGLMNRTSRKAALMLFDIRQRGSWPLWKQLSDDERTGVAFDCRSLGIIMMDKTRYKEYYKL